MTYTYNEIINAAKDYFNGGELEASVWAEKYAMKDNNGAYYEKTPTDMHIRLAREFARIDEEKYGIKDTFNIYFDAIDKFERIVPQGSPMSAVGNYLRTMSASNCVVVDSPHDSIGGIFKTATELAQLYKRRCGVGTDVSTLRPNKWAVNNAAKATTGPVSFCDFYSEVTRRIGQDGRRGALMLTMDVHHPDVEEFAAMKGDRKKVTGANVSVRLSDEFLNAVVNDSEYEQRWPCEGEPKFTRMVKARKVWDTIIKYATVCAEPGLIFWGPMTRRLPAHFYPGFKSTSTNPCSEICLSPYDSCRLISINLTGYVLKPFDKNATFNFEKFRNDVALAIRMADNLVDIEVQLIDKILERCEDAAEGILWTKLQNAAINGRRVGVGTHGLADSLAQLNIKYDSKEALEACDSIYKVLRDTAYRTSVELAKERGPFPIFDWEIDKNNEYIKDLPKDVLKDMAVYGRRNISMLTNAPTGSVSLMSKTGPEFKTYQTSSGIEPVYKNSHIRRRKGNPGEAGFRTDRIDDLGDHWMEFKVHHSNLSNWAAKTNSNLDKIPDIFVESGNVNWEFRVELQGTIQKYLDHSISSTINLPHGTATDVVGGIYLKAWKSGLKGVTVYVDGSRDGVLVDEKEAAANKGSERPTKIKRVMAPKRPKELKCDIHTHSIKGKKWTAIVGLLDGEPYEIFGGFADAFDVEKYKTGTIVRKGQGKYCLIFEDGHIVDDLVNKMTNELGWATRLISTALRHGTPIEFMVEQLGKDGGINDYNKIFARVLKKYIGEGKKVLSSTKCVNCNGVDFAYEDGCPKCLSCGYTKCN